MNQLAFEKIKTPEELYQFMKQNIQYGFYSSLDHKTYSRREMQDDELYESLLFGTYMLQTPEEILTSGYGICYDQVELERSWFLNHNYEVFTYYTPYHNHAFLVYSNGNTYNVFERTIKKYNGIHLNSSLDEALNNYKKLQLEDKNITDILLYPYENVPFGCDFYGFIDFVTKEDQLGSKLKQKMKSFTK